MKTVNIKQSISFNCNPQDIYNILMDSKKHSKLTSSVAKIGKKEGDTFYVWGGDIHGINLELIPNKKIIQSWRYNYPDWPKDYFSKVTFNIKDLKGKSKIIFFHTGIPEKYAKDIANGWKEYYWTPMKELLSKLKV